MRRPLCMHVNRLVMQKDNGNKDQRKAEKQRNKWIRKKEASVKLLKIHGTWSTMSIANVETHSSHTDQDILDTCQGKEIVRNAILQSEARKNYNKDVKNGSGTAIVCFLVTVLHVLAIMQSVSQRWSCWDIFTCCHTEQGVASQTCYLTESQYTATGPTRRGNCSHKKGPKNSLVLLPCQLASQTI